MPVDISRISVILPVRIVAKSCCAAIGIYDWIGVYLDVIILTRRHEVIDASQIELRIAFFGLGKPNVAVDLAIGISQNSVCLSDIAT